MNDPTSPSTKSPITTNSSESTVDFMVQWQSLVVAGYRSIWRELAQQSGWAVTMVAPHQFREGGMQDLVCAANDPRNPPLITLPVKRLHTQAVWFKQLASTLRSWLSASQRPKIFLCFAEPYSLTAIFSLIALIQARLITRRSNPRPRVLFYGFQNIQKKLPLPLRLAQHLVFRFADAILVAGAEHELVLRSHGFRGRCIKLPMWFDPQVFFCPVKETNSGGHNLTVGYAGSLLPEKGISQILDALIDRRQQQASSVERPLDGLTFEIAGDGILKPEIIEKTAALKKLGVHAIYHGPIAAPDMAKFYQSIDILVVPSLTARHWKEQFGRVIIEAMACGCVVIGSDSGEIPNVIEDRHRIFPENDPQGFLDVLAHAVQCVKNDRPQARRRMSEYALKKFGDHVVAKNLLGDLLTLA